ELGHQLLVDRRLGAEVEVVQRPRRRQTGESFESGPASDLGRAHLDLEEAGQELGVAEPLLAGMVELSRQRFGGSTETQVGQMAPNLLIGGGLAHRATSS